MVAEPVTGADGRPLLLHRIRLDRSLINGKPDISRPVPCERCGAPIYLMLVEHFCSPGRVHRKIAEEAGGQYVRHRCRVQPVPLDAPRCERCDALMLEWVDGKVAEADRLLAEAVEASRVARLEYERAVKRLQRVTARARRDFSR